MSSRCPVYVSREHPFCRRLKTKESWFREAVRETMSEVETNVYTRSQVDDKRVLKKTNNLLWAEFIHGESRPVNGVPDPHLHAHVIVMNATYEPDEKRFKAIHWKPTYSNAPFYESVFHSKFSSKIEDLGYEVERSGKFWEIKGINRDVIDKFSKRTKQVESAILDQEEKFNRNLSEKEKSEMGSKSRKRKGPAISKEEL